MQPFLLRQRLTTRSKEKKIETQRHISSEGDRNKGDAHRHSGHATPHLLGTGLIGTPFF